MLHIHSTSEEDACCLLPGARRRCWFSKWNGKTAPPALLSLRAHLHRITSPAPTAPIFPFEELHLLTSCFSKSIETNNTQTSRSCPECLQYEESEPMNTLASPRTRRIAFESTLRHLRLISSSASQPRALPSLAQASISRALRIPDTFKACAHTTRPLRNLVSVCLCEKQNHWTGSRRAGVGDQRCTPWHCNSYAMTGVHISSPGERLER